MDETLSAVREELRNLLVRERVREDGSVRGSYGVADAILARFEVTEKPVVTDAVLGDMAALAVNVRHWHPATVGQLLRQQLTEAGLMIVLAEDGHR